MVPLLLKTQLVLDLDLSGLVTWNRLSVRRSGGDIRVGGGIGSSACTSWEIDMFDEDEDGLLGVGRDRYLQGF